MAITITGAAFKGFTFDGISSRDYGVYTTGEAVYNAPERDVEIVEVAGRNGAVIIDNGRFRNISVTFKCGMYANNETDFANGISALRNALCSRVGYCRIEDEYNPDEYRLGVYASGLEVDTVNANKAGEFDIVFDCMPQRFLKSGETAQTITSGSTLTNPTLFNAYPLLQFGGIGTITIGGRNIIVNDVFYGWIEIADYYRSTSIDYNVVDTSYTLDMTNVNTGDDIMAGDYTNGNIGTFHAIARLKNAPTFNDVSYTYSTRDFYFNVNFNRSSSTEVEAGVSFSRVFFTAGTNATKEATGTITLYQNETRVAEIQWDATAHYIANTNTIRVVLQISGAKFDQGVTTLWSPYQTYELSIPKTVADSTKSTLTGTTFVDLDIAESWIEESGQSIRSANDHVDIGAVVPFLKSGNTRITYSNTITNLKITPRWWRV